MAVKEEKQTADTNLKSIRAQHAPLQKKIDDEKKKKEAKFNLIKAKVWLVC